MTAATLAGRRILGELHTRHGEVEAALALGLTDADARRLVAGPWPARHCSQHWTKPGR